MKLTYQWFAKTYIAVTYLDDWDAEASISARSLHNSSKKKTLVHSSQTHLMNVVPSVGSAQRSCSRCSPKYHLLTDATSRLVWRTRQRLPTFCPSILCRGGGTHSHGASIPRKMSAHNQIKTLAQTTTFFRGRLFQGDLIKLASG